MRDVQTDAFRGRFDSDGIAIEFGRHRTGPEGPEGSPGAIALTERIVMPLATAKRLVLVLADALRPYPAEALSGERDQRGEVPRNAPPDAAGAHGALLLRLVGELGIPCQHERSFRLTEGELLANRFLLSLNAGDIPANALERVLTICDALHMPQDLRRMAEKDYGHAACVHFGFEGGEGGAVAKLYFERAIAPEAALKACERAEALLLHRAFKWDVDGAAGGTSVVTEYNWHPLLGTAEIAERLEVLYGDASPSLAIVRGMLELAAARAPDAHFQFLQVEEENGRRSFDLNVYDAKLQVSDAQPLLDAMRERCEVRPGRFQALYDQIKTRPLGHVAGGIHRNRREFFNVYYGVTGFPLFSQRFG
ncbi:MAG: hypothetical protein IH604_21030 [Burkholderiales bacterium]|nr:hypothetical protein [Burkholderiales bacterium]